VRRADLAGAVNRLLTVMAASSPDLRPRLAERPKIADMAPAHLSYPAAAVAVASGMMPLLEGGRFERLRPVIGRGGTEVDCAPATLADVRDADRAVGNLTVANQLTILRIMLVPAFVLLVVYGQFGWALVFSWPGLTDAFDGLIARRTGQQKTQLGAWLDPMADKLLLVTTFMVLTLPGIPLVNHLPLWLTVFVISRDVASSESSRS
jgi:hypothetical protein